MKLQLPERFRAVACATLSALTLSALVNSAQASNLVVNGSFESLLVDNTPSEFGTRHPAQEVTGWTTDGYNFIFTPGTADTDVAVSEFGHLALWGPNSGSNNGLPATSPDGGNFVAMDGAFDVGALSQTIDGLTPGQDVTVSFWWAGAQQSGFSGPTTEQVTVSLGSDSQSTVVLDNVSHGFTGWQQQSFTFTPTSTSEVLSFLAVGTPNGVPPFVLLDGVSLDASDTPEPGTWALLILGVAGLGASNWLRRKFAPASGRA